MQAVVLAEHDGLTTPNPYGHLPLHGCDPARPNEAYFEHVDFVVGGAAALGLFVGMLPTWGDKWNRRWGVGPEVFEEKNAARFGEFLGRRYRDAPVVWILGGDRIPETGEHHAIILALARGLKAGDGGRHLIGYHPSGQHTSADYFHDEPWLDLNMIQSGHSCDRDNHGPVAADYARTPPKPCMDAEPGYEDHPDGFDPERGYLTDADARRFAYGALFAGAHGHTYGCHDIWQMWQPGREPITRARTPWQKALDLPGARQMRHARALLESRPFFTRIPDGGVLLQDPGPDPARATRDAEGAYALVYSPTGQPFVANTAPLSGETVRAHWYDPRQGTTAFVGEFQNNGARRFVPPTSGSGNDWILVLDDAARDFPAPGRMR